jgi:predicted dinucleotide-binding enzyme
MYNSSLKIGIIGSGIVGRVLGAAFLKEGNKVLLGTREIKKAEVVKWQNDHEGSLVGSFKEAAAFGDIIVLATAGSVVLDAIDMAELSSFAGKTVIDATNPIAANPPTDGVLSFFTDYNNSLMELIQQKLPNANLVKAFSCVGNAFMYKPDFKDGKPTMFICGNDSAAKMMVTEICLQFGWEIADMGKAAAARAIEPLCILWCLPGFTQNKWNHAFKLLQQ